MRDGTTRSPSDIRDRIMEAALATLREKGIVGTSARVIARRGGFNQALIFYHFGSITGLLIEAFARSSEAQVAKYRAAAEGVRSLSDLVEIARRLHAEDEASGSITTVTQLMAAASSDPQLGRAIMDRFEVWMSLVEDALARAVEGGPIEEIVPAKEAAHAISAMFLGMELMTRLDPDRAMAEPVFDVMANLARVVEDVARALYPPRVPSPAETGQADARRPGD